MVTSRALKDFLIDSAFVAAFTLIQCIWLSVFASRQAGLVNLLPTFLFLAIWYRFIEREFEPKRFWWFFLPGFILTLRLPFTLSRWLEPLNWVLYLVVLWLVLRRIVNYFKTRKQAVLLIATALIILFNAVGHVFLDSPFTYGFRILNNTPSNFTGVDNNTTWECPYEHAAIAVSCDMRHYLMTERIFTKDDPQQTQQAVFLNRFFYGYLSSLVGFPGTRWIASFTLNLVFWFLACVAVFKTAILLNVHERIAAIAMLCCASGIGFVYFVGQPSPHTAAYAFAGITLWATVEIICSDDRNDQTLLSLIIISGPLFYEMYSVTLASFLLLWWCRRGIVATGIFASQVLLTLLWRRISLPVFLGTVGNVKNSGTQNLVRDIEAWKSVITHIDLGQGLHFVSKGLQSYLYGGLIFGAIASVVYIIYLLDQRYSHHEKRYDLLIKFCLCLSVVTLAAAVFVSPDVALWNPATGLQPRHSFFTYPVNAIAIAALSTWIFKKPYQYAPVVFTFLLVNVSLFGFVSFEAWFDYGLIGLYWK